jgi:hypothetical protein
MLQRNLIVLFLLLSCKSPYEFWTELYDQVIAASELKVFQEELYNEKVITTPPNNERILLEFITDHEKYCLIYRTPYKSKKTKQPGVLSLATSRKKEKCDIYSHRLASVELQYLKASFVNYKKKENFKPQLIFEGEMKEFGKSRSYHYAIPLINLEYSSQFKKAGKKLKEDIDNEKFSFKKFPTFFESIAFKHPKEPLVELKQFDMNELCHQHAENCSNDIEYQCDRCPGAFTEVLGGLCPTKRDKACGDFTCDKVDAPACFRGEIFLSSKVKRCEDLLPAAYCASELKPKCVRGYVICQ